MQPSAVLKVALWQLYAGRHVCGLIFPNEAGDHSGLAQTLNKGPRRATQKKEDLRKPPITYIRQSRSLSKICIVRWLLSQHAARQCAGPI